MAAPKKQQTLLREMEGGFNQLLAKEICDWCHKKDCDPFEEFVTTKHVSQETYDKWATDDARRFIEDYMTKLRQRAKANILDGDDDLAKRDRILALMNPYFITTKENGSTLYSIVDGSNLIVEPCCTNNVQQQVAQRIKHTFWASNGIPSKGLINGILDIYECNCEIQPAPKLWAQPDEPVYCLARAMVRPDPTVPYPHIQPFLDRLNDSTAFCAYLWGVYSGQNIGRQSLYVSEETGESGKSSFMRAFQRLFGDAITAALNWNVLNNSTHASAHFAGKKFVVIGDNKNPNILMTQAVKELSGDDKTMINEKYQAVYSTYLECRLVVLSNMPVNITSERHNQSRTLWVILAPLTVPVDGTWADHYDAEMPGFLAHCQQCYAERCPDNYEIRVNDAVKEAVALRVEEYESKFGLAFDQLFMLEPSAKLSLADFQREMDMLKWNDHERSNFLLWMSRVFFKGNMSKERDKHGMFYRGVRLKNAKDRRSASSPMGGLDDDDDAPFSADNFTGGHSRYDA